MIASKHVHLDEGVYPYQHTNNYRNEVDDTELQRNISYENDSKMKMYYQELQAAPGTHEIKEDERNVRSVTEEQEDTLLKEEQDSLKEF